MCEWPPNRFLCVQALTKTLSDGIQLCVTADCVSHFSAMSYLECFGNQSFFVHFFPGKALPLVQEALRYPLGDLLMVEGLGWSAAGCDGIVSSGKLQIVFV